MDLKANKVDITPSSVSTTRLIANEWNQLVTENTNVITTGGGLTPSSKDRKQMVASIEKISEDKTKEVMSETYDKIDDWVKPKDWIDIRGGALPNSVYFLVGHSAPTGTAGSYTIATYPQIAFYATVSNSGNYDVYVDGVNIATTASGTATTITWANLYNAGTLVGGYDVTYPRTLTTHVVRITPSLSTNNITAIRHDAISNNIQYGTLWEHFTTTSVLDIQLLNRGAISSPICKTLLLEAVTCASEELKINMFGIAFSGCSSLKTVPIFDCTSYFGSYATETFMNCSQLKEVILKNFNITELGGGMFVGCSNLQYVNITPSFQTLYQQFADCPKLKHLPSSTITNGASSVTVFFRGCVGLEPFSFDYTNTQCKRLTLGGTSTARIDGLKGLTVSNNAPFDNTTSPQLDVSYTGLDRSALINLFNSLPYNVGYEVVGSPTISNGVASGFSSSNYLKTSQTFDSANISNYEIVIRAKHNDATTNNALIGLGTGFAGEWKIIFSKSKLSFVPSRSADSIEISNNFGTDYYYIRVRYNNATATVDYCTDGINYQGAVTKTFTELSSANAYVVIGYLDNYSAFFDGFIDLNQTYIKLNGVPWFRGTAAMTKTCNITGATGAASLDNTDLAIATSKGWTVTR